MKTHLVTGATGFLGSALAASFLERGAAVLAPSRHDPDGARTTAAVLAAARGFGSRLSADAMKRLTVLPCEYGKLEDALTPQVLLRVDDVWHCAAEMTYSLAKVRESFDLNTAGTARLYDLARAHAPGCGRFHYVSTAYTAGMAGGAFDEVLHFAPALANAYQISKWAAEQALANLSRGSLPVTIFRPSAILGHRGTGWSAGKCFGYYMFIRVFWEAARAGCKEITFDVDPDARFDGIPIDDVVLAAQAFASRPREASPVGLEIVHASNPHQLTTREHFERMGEAVGVGVAFGKPRTAFDRKIDEVIAINRGFASGTWEFRNPNLRAVVGPSYCREPLGRAEVLGIIRDYLGVLERESARPVARTGTSG